MRGTLGLTAAAIVAAALLAACGSMATPSPSAIGAVTAPTSVQTASATPATPEVTPSPSPEVAPTPTPDMTKWYNQLPANPYAHTRVNAIPLPKNWFGYPTEGTLVMSPFPYEPSYAVTIYAATIIAVVPDIAHRLVWVELATAKPGTKVARTNCKLTSVNDFPDVTLCSYAGPTLWLRMDDRTWVYNSSGSKRFGQGLIYLAKYLKVGDVIKSDFELGPVPGSTLTPADIAMNTQSWANLRRRVGLSIARTDKPNAEFSFQAGNLSIYPAQ